MDLRSLMEWAGGAMDTLGEREAAIAKEPLKEIHARLGFLLDMGLDYLTLDRPARSLSGGEAQRIRLATQIGSKLTGVLYILDEPSIGLHQRDNQRLIDSLKTLRDVGNTVIVVEHDEDMMRQADHLIDRPGAASTAGWWWWKDPRIHVAQGSVTASSSTDAGASPSPRSAGRATAKSSASSAPRAQPPVGGPQAASRHLHLRHRSERQRQEHLINQTLHPALHNHFYEETKRPPLQEAHGPAAPGQGHRHRPEPHRTHAAPTPHLHRCLQRNPHPLHPAAGAKSAATSLAFSFNVVGGAAKPARAPACGPSK